MQFNTFSVRDFGVFRGRHDFSLEPTRASSGKRPLIVISGHNGSGKSTLFQAMALALYGPLVLGNRVTRHDYNDYLLGRFHRYATTDGLIIADTCSVLLSCSFVISGQPMRVQIERVWNRRGQQVDEELRLLADGAPPDVPREDFQAWLNDLVPFGLDTVLFFDAEQLEALSRPEQHDELLARSLRRLLGLDLAEQLNSDLSYYLRQQTGDARLEELRQRVIDKQRALDEVEQQLIEARAKSSNLAAQEMELRSQIMEQERRLAAAGGSFAERRAASQGRLRQIENEIEQVSTQLRDLAAELLPFTLVPEFTEQLRRQLLREAELQRVMAVQESWTERTEEARARLLNKNLWRDVDISTELRVRIVDRLLNILRDDDSLKTGDVIVRHHLASPDRDQLLRWIHASQDETPLRTLALTDRLRELKEERRGVQRDLLRAPDDSLLLPIYEEIKRLEERVDELAAVQTALDHEIGVAEFQQLERERERDAAATALQDLQSKKRQLDLAQRSKLVLRTYQEALTRQRLNVLEEHITRAFNAVCRKEQLLASVSINPDSFAVKLVGADGHILGVGDLSAGEFQLYVLSLLQALREVSRRQLPLAIDTPLARLDEVHRQRLMQDYIPVVSQQVVLFTTDAELNDGLLQQATNQLSRLYRLVYSPSEQQTTVSVEDAGVKRGLISLNGIGVKVLKVAPNVP